jgi:uncharacterized protein
MPAWATCRRKHRPLTGRQSAASGLSIGTATLPDEAYLDAVADFVERVHAPWYSEHLAFTGVPGRDLAQLLPLPRTRDSLEVVAQNLAIVRAHVPVPVVLENITYYFTWPQDEYDDLSFLMRALDESGAFLLLDLENLRINAVNHGLDPVAFIDALPPGIVRATRRRRNARGAGSYRHP